MAESDRLKNKISPLFGNMTYSFYMVSPTELQPRVTITVNTAWTDSLTSQAPMASNGEAKIFSPLWVFAWNQSLRAQSPKSETGKEIASVFYQEVQLFLGNFVKFHPLGKNHGFLSICPGWKSDISIMIWQISIWENCLLFSQWIWSKNEKSFTLSIKLFKRKKKICTFPALK